MTMGEGEECIEWLNVQMNRANMHPQDKFHNEGE